jgi:hypothetical protein
MSKLSWMASLAVLTLASPGCDRPEQKAQLTTESRQEQTPHIQIEPPSTTATIGKAEASSQAARPTIRVGQPLAEALENLKVSMAHEFTDKVGTFRPISPDEPYRVEDRWFLLRGRTCLRVLVRTEGVPERSFIEHLTLGEEGRGYGGKERWPEQKLSSLDSLELP